jgi:hypothetical protein
VGQEGLAWAGITKNRVASKQPARGSNTMKGAVRCLSKLTIPEKSSNNVARRQPWGSQSWRHVGGALRRATFLYGF